jgi:tetratricopeptide (TPR) repeat protein
MVSCSYSTGLYEDILKAQEFIKSNEYSKASSLYERILDKNPSSEIKNKVLFQLGEINYKHLGQFKKAINYFSIVIKNTNDVLWHVKASEKIADIYMNNIKDYNEAINIYSKLMSFEKKLAKSDFYNFQKAKAFTELKNYKTAIKIYSEIINNKEEFSKDALNELAKIYFVKRKWKLAIKYWKSFNKVSKNNNKKIIATYFIANSYENLDLLEKSYETYSSLIGKYPNQEILNARLESVYQRRVDRKR